MATLASRIDITMKKHTLIQVYSPFFGPPKSQTLISDNLIVCRAGHWNFPIAEIQKSSFNSFCEVSFNIWLVF